MDWEKWQNALYAWAVETTGLEAVWAAQATDAPQLRKPYILLDVLAVVARGEDNKVLESANDGADFSVTTAGQREITVNLQVVSNATGSLADSGFAWAEELHASLHAGAATLSDAGLFFQGVGTLTDLNTVEQSQYVSRVSMDITFTVAAVKRGAATGPAIQRIIGSGDVEGNSDPEITFDVEGS
jgi:hypothetical protein